MKKLLFALVAVSMMAFTSLSTKADMKVGGGVGYGTGISEIAVQLGAIFDSSLPVDIAPDFKYFFIASEATNVSITAWELNANAHYTFHEENDLRVFGIGGLSYANYSYDYSGPGSEILNTFGGSSYGRVGLNLGAGADFDLKGFHLIPELKFTVGGNEQLFIGVSAMFTF